MRYILIPFLMLISMACHVVERPTGYGGNPTLDGYTVKTCDESDFDGQWLSFHTDNAIANTFVPAYKDYCTHVTPDWVFFWNSVEKYGYYNYDFDWYCKNDTTMRIEDPIAGDIIDVKIYGELPDGCHSVKISYNSKSAHGEICPCEYNGP